MIFKRKMKQLLSSAINISIAAVICLSTVSVNINGVQAAVGSQSIYPNNTGVDFAALQAENANVYIGSGRHGIVLGNVFVEEEIARPVLWKAQQASNVFIPEKNLVSNTEWILQNGLTQSEREAFIRDSSGGFTLNKDAVVFASQISQSPGEMQIASDNIFTASQNGEVNYKLTILGASNGASVGSINGVANEPRYVGIGGRYTLSNTNPVDFTGAFPVNNSDYYYSINYKMIDSRGVLIGYGKSFDLDNIVIETDKLSYGSYKVFVWLQKNNYRSSNEASGIKQFDLIIDPDPLSMNSYKSSDIPYITYVSPRKAKPGTQMFAKCSSSGHLYIVPKTTEPSLAGLKDAVANPNINAITVPVESNQELALDTSGLKAGEYMVYAVSEGGIVSSSVDITLDESVMDTTITHEEGDIVAGPFTITITFSTSVKSFDIKGIEGINCVISDLKGANNKYTALVTPIAVNGEVTVKVIQGAAITEEDKENIESNLIRVKYDPTKPKVRFSFSNNQYFAAKPESISIEMPNSDLYLVSTGEKVTDMQGLIPLLLSMTKNNAAFTGYTAVYSQSTHSIVITFASLDQATYKVNIIGNIVKNDLNSVLDSTSATFTYSVPSVTSLAASATSFRAQGGTFMLSVVGQNLTGHNITVLVDGLVYCQATVIKPTLATAVIVAPSNQMSTNQTHTATVLLNNVLVQDKTLQFVVTTTPIPALTELIPNVTAFPGSGGTMTMTIKGENIASTSIKVYYDNEQKATATINADQSYATASIAIPANTEKERKTHVISAILTYGTANTPSYVCSTVSVIIDVQEAVTQLAASQPNNAPFIDANTVKIYPEYNDFENGKLSIKVGKTNDVSYVTVPSSILSSLLKFDDEAYFEFIAQNSIFHVPMDFSSTINGLSAILTKANLREDEISYKFSFTEKTNTKDYKATVTKDMPKSSIVSPIVECTVNVLDSKGAAIGALESFSIPFKRFIPITVKSDDSIMFYNVYKYTDATKTYSYVPSTVQFINNGWYSEYSSKTPGIYLVVNNPVTYRDTTYHWAKDYIHALVSKKVMTGVIDVYFDPDSPINRVDFITSLIKAMGLADEKPVTTNLQFDDYKKEAKNYNELCIAKDIGLLRFETSRLFKPNQAITRDEVSYVLHQLIKFYGLANASYTKEDALAFISTSGDPTLMSEKYAREVAFVAELDLTLTPVGYITKDRVTRAEAAAVLVNTLEYFKKISY